MLCCYKDRNATRMQSVWPECLKTSFLWQTASISCTWFAKLIWEGDLDWATCVLKTDGSHISLVTRECSSDKHSIIILPNIWNAPFRQEQGKITVLIAISTRFLCIPAWLDKFSHETMISSSPAKKTKEHGKKFLIVIAHSCKNLLV